MGKIVGMNIYLNYTVARYKVEIVEVSSSEMWYADKVGEVFEVRRLRYDEEADGFVVDDCRDENSSEGWINYQDAIVLEVLKINKTPEEALEHNKSLGLNKR